MNVSQRTKHTNLHLSRTHRFTWIWAGAVLSVVGTASQGSLTQTTTKNRDFPAVRAQTSTVAAQDLWLRMLIRRMLLIIECLPEPSVEEPTAELLKDLNTCYAMSGIPGNLTPQERENALSTALALEEELKNESGTIEPNLYAQTMQTLNSIEFDLGYGGSSGHSR